VPTSLLVSPADRPAGAAPGVPRRAPTWTAGAKTTATSPQIS